MSFEVTVLVNGFAVKRITAVILVSGKLPVASPPLELEVCDPPDGADELELMELANKVPPVLEAIARDKEALRFFRRATEVIKSPEGWRDLQAYLEPRRKLWPWLAAVAGVLLVVGGLTVWSLGRDGKDGDPARGSGGTGRRGAGEGTSLKGHLDVWVTEKGNKRRDGLLLQQAGALPLRPGDVIEYEIGVNRPAYLYVFWIGSDGRVKKVWKKVDTKRHADEVLAAMRGE